MCSVRSEILSVRNGLTLVLALAGNDALAQVVTITQSIPTPIPLWAVGLLSLILAILGYWALRTRLPTQLNRLHGWPLMAIVSAAALALVTSGAWMTRAYAIPGVAAFNITGNPSNSGGPVLPNTDIPVTNATGGPFTIGSVSVDCSGLFALQAAPVPRDASAPGAPVTKTAALVSCSLVPPTTHASASQCVPGLTLSSGGVCYVNVSMPV